MPGTHRADGVEGRGPQTTRGPRGPEITGQAQKQLLKTHGVSLGVSGTWGCPAVAQEASQGHSGSLQGLGAGGGSCPSEESGFLELKPETDCSCSFLKPGFNRQHPSSALPPGYPGRNHWDCPNGGRHIGSAECGLPQTQRRTVWEQKPFPTLRRSREGPLKGRGYGATARKGRQGAGRRPELLPLRCSAPADGAKGPEAPRAIRGGRVCVRGAQSGRTEMSARGFG